MAQSKKVLTQRALNRALLERQWLLNRVEDTPSAVMEHVIGLQAQTPQTPYVGLWSRLHEFDPLETSRGLLEKKTVRMVLMRGTLHWVTAKDALTLRVVTAPALERMFQSASHYGKRLKGLDVSKVISFGAAQMERSPLTLAELRPQLAKKWPKWDPTSLGAAVHYHAGLVQLPPRGQWRESGAARCTTLETWLGKKVPASVDLRRVVKRYLQAFGPASPADIFVWSGVPALKQVMTEMRAAKMFRVYHDEEGRELLDGPDLPLPHEDTPAPPRFLPDYDNVLLSHLDRSRVARKEDRIHYPKFGAQPGGVLIDGFLRATWKCVVEKSSARVEVVPFAKRSASEVEALEKEGARLVRFLRPEATALDVRVLNPSH